MSMFKFMDYSIGIFDWICNKVVGSQKLSFEYKK